MAQLGNHREHTVITCCTISKRKLHPRILKMAARLKIPAFFGDGKTTSINYVIWWGKNCGGDNNIGTQLDTQKNGGERKKIEVILGVCEILIIASLCEQMCCLRLDFFLSWNTKLSLQTSSNGWCNKNLPPILGWYYFRMVLSTFLKPLYFKTPRMNIFATPILIQIQNQNRIRNSTSLFLAS